MGKQMRPDTPDHENPEWTAKDIARAGKASDFPELARTLRPGRPELPEELRKQRVTMYLDRDVIARLKEDGKGWQTRANAKLRAALGL
jgi:uncharacterized protein (DUF4415 family)